MPKLSKQNIIKGREAVDAYRAAHAQLHSAKWHKGIPEAHTPLLNTMLAGLKKQGFNSLNEFFVDSELLNIRELGFASREDVKTEADIKALDRMWH